MRNKEPQHQFMQIFNPHPSFPVMSKVSVFVLSHRAIRYNWWRYCHPHWIFTGIVAP